MEYRDDALLWIWLSLACGAGSPAAEPILRLYGDDLRPLYEADAQTLEEIEGLTTAVVQALLDKNLQCAEQILTYCRSNGVGLLCPADAAYPARLRAIRACPLLLYYKGTLPDFDRRVCIATVGTRHMTEYGKKTAYTLSFDLARAGAVVVSGMASGIDGMCHRGALDASGDTVAILGCGIDRAYPPYHRELMDELFQSGAVMTEYAPGTEPFGKNFPLRNRIISGLCQGTVVVEADAKSGALITARNALYQGRDLFAVPGKIGEQNSDGTNRLLKSGSKLITSAVDILEEYEHLYPDQIHIDRIPQFLPKRPHRTPQKREAKEQESARVASPTLTPPAPFKVPTARTVAPPKAPPTPTAPVDLPQPPMDANEKAVIVCLDRSTSIDCDAICRKTNLPIAAVLTALTLLEIKGLVQALPGGLYRLH